ncbi:hypothetical protein N7527_007766 [Penicillium freii]|uniref:Uncharacterized protein n=1 Tax=Penicillium freii TaxID=48697 RepID=A0A117NRM2_PENFR|nr:hypothetical protein N7527_007766 [Penicillium freii]KUM65823.1 hypothetical protein ACN42_g1233 [Penicillium freii]
MAPWLLNRNAGTVNRFMGGLVPIYTVNVTLDSYEPLAGSKPPKKWTVYAQDNQVYFEGNAYCDDPIIALSETVGKSTITTPREQVRLPNNIQL